jgi:hypothetical protein
MRRTRKKHFGVFVDRASSSLPACHARDGGGGSSSPTVLLLSLLFLFLLVLSRSATCSLAILAWCAAMGHLFLSYSFVSTASHLFPFFKLDGKCLKIGRIRRRRAISSRWMGPCTLPLTHRGALRLSYTPLCDSGFSRARSRPSSLSGNRTAATLAGRWNTSNQYQPLGVAPTHSLPSLFVPCFFPLPLFRRCVRPALCRRRSFAGGPVRGWATCP